MVSLLKLAEINEEGVHFKSPYDGIVFCLSSCKFHYFYVKNSYNFVIHLKVLIDVGMYIYLLINANAVPKNTEMLK